MSFMRNLLASAVVLGIGAAGLYGYFWWQNSQKPRPPSVANQICNDDRECLKQNWTEDQRGWWYTVSQGSRLYPLSWFKALELADSQNKFASDAHLLGTLGYIANVADNNPQKLPLGFAVDFGKDGENLMCDVFPETCASGTMQQDWVGLNCAACHTNDITLNGEVVRVEGAPTVADFQALEETLHAATKATLGDEAKFARFAGEVLGGDATDTAVASLRTQLEEQSVWQARLEEKNATPGYRYGHGRLDAQGHILNKIALLLGDINDEVAFAVEKDGVFDEPFKVMANAPASYPFVWNTSQQVFIEWNGIATNTARVKLGGLDTDPGALIRNVSEVIGVFGHVDAQEGTALRGYKSSLRMGNMVDLEQVLQKLYSPQWPASFPDIDQEAAKRGKALFGEHCADCHNHLEHDDIESPAKEEMHTIMEFGASQDEAKSPAMTDPLLVCNTYYHGSHAGNFAGQEAFVFKGPTIAERDFTRNLLVNGTVGTISGKLDELLASMIEDTFGFGAPRPPLLGTETPSEIVYMPDLEDEDMKAFIKMCTKEAATLTALQPDGHILSYKARPLNGIWATAPYLHNGSVPTLYDLLLPSDMQVSTHHPVPASDKYRPNVFGVGSREYDAEKGGFVSDPDANPFVFRTRTEAGEPIPGNYNSGHDYGNADFTEKDRKDLVEYLKTL